MKCLFCGDRLMDDTKGFGFTLSNLCQFSLYRDAGFVVFSVCDKRKIAIFDKDYYEAIGRMYSFFKEEYDWIEYECDDHEEFKTIDRRIIETGFLF